MDTTTIALVILAVAAGGIIVVLFANSARKRQLAEDVPPAMRPGYSDQELESSVLERYMGWGLVLTLFFAVFLPAYWLNEGRRIREKQQTEFAENFVAGETLYEANCMNCHGSDASGGSALSPYGDEPWPAPNLLTLAARYADSDIVSDVRDHVETTIKRGRPGTPMPSWGAEFGGPMTDFQIEAITDFLLASQVDEVTEARPAADLSGEDLYAMNCMRCHGAELQGIVGPSLVGVFERHSAETVQAIIANGIDAGAGLLMPPWQNGYMYEEGRFTDDALQRIVSYLDERQPAQLPPDAGQYQTPGVGEPVATPTPEPTEAA